MPEAVHISSNSTPSPFSALLPILSSHLTPLETASTEPSRLDRAIAATHEWCKTLSSTARPDPHELDAFCDFLSKQILDFKVDSAACFASSEATTNRDATLPHAPQPRSREGTKIADVILVVKTLIVGLSHGASAPDGRWWSIAGNALIEGLLAHLEENDVGARTPRDLAYRTFLCSKLAGCLVKVVVPDPDKLPKSAADDLAGFGQNSEEMASKYAALEVLGTLLSKNERNKAFLAKLFPPRYLGAILHAAWDHHLSRLTFELAFRLLPPRSAAESRATYLHQLFSEDLYGHHKESLAPSLRRRMDRLDVSKDWEEGYQDILKKISAMSVLRSQFFEVISLEYDRNQLLRANDREAALLQSQYTPSLHEIVKKDFYEPELLWISRHIIASTIVVPGDRHEQEEIEERLVVPLQGVVKLFVEDLDALVPSRKSKMHTDGSLDCLRLTIIIDTSHPLTISSKPYPAQPSHFGSRLESIPESQASENRAADFGAEENHRLVALIRKDDQVLKVLRETLWNRGKQYAPLLEEMADFPKIDYRPRPASPQVLVAPNKRLGDIVNVLSGLEPSLLHPEVGATRKAENSPVSTNRDGADAECSRPMNNGSTSELHSRRRSKPIPGRELRRIPLPPTPVVKRPSQHRSSPLRQSFRADDSFEPLNGSSPATVTPATNAAPLESSYANSASHDFVPEDSLALPIPPVQFFHSSRPSQATQQIAESSPEVPLAHLQQRASAASLQSNRRNPTPSPSRVASNGHPSSNGGIVPDSEGFTQPDQDEEEERPAELLRSPAVQRIRDENSDPESSTSLEGKTLEDMLAASSGVTDTKKARQAEEEVPKVTRVDRNGEGEVETDATKGTEVVRKKSASREVRDPSQVESEVETKSKGKGKEKKKVAVEHKKKKSTGGKESGKKAAKGKGKAMEAREEESGEEASNDDNGEFEETNYSDAPRGKKNSKKMSPKKLQPVVVAPPRRKASRPSIVEQSDHEEAPEVVAPARRKRQASPAHEETKPTSKRAKASAPTKPVKAPPKKPSLSRSRKGEPPTSRASRSTEPEQPVAGPSRLRFADQEDTSTPRREESAAPSDSKPSTSTKLLPSAPFSRCFGLWRDDGYYYPGTITHVTSERFHVKFDDTSGGKLRPDEVRRCEFEKGDWVQYSGAEELDTETREFRVLEVKRSEDAGAVGGELSGRDVVVAVEPADFGTEGARTHDLLVEAVRILRLRGVQFNNRKLTRLDLDAFEGKTHSDVKPLPLLPAPTRPPVSAFEDAPREWGVLGRTALLVTNASIKSSPNDPTARAFKQSDKEQLIDSLRTAGATVVDWEHLFVARVDKETGKPIVTFPRANFTDIDTILLLSDRPTTTMKFLVALSLGIPCCSIEFANATIRENTRLDWEPYLLPSGYLDLLKFFGIGGQLRALRKSTHDITSLERAQRGDGIFAGQSFLVVTEKPGKSRDEKTAFNRQAYQILSLLACCSAARVDFLPLPFDASSKSFLSNPSEFVDAVSRYTHIFLDFEETHSNMESAARPLIKSHKGIVNMNWVKKCLVAGRMEPSDRVHKVQET